MKPHSFLTSIKNKATKATLLVATVGTVIVSQASAAGEIEDASSAIGAYATEISAAAVIIFGIRAIFKAMSLGNRVIGKA